ncbi:hypothetical protein RSAG8_06405, partial [Rhizoctonia solani AG-8 WAC10335]
MISSLVAPKLNLWHECPNHDSRFICNEYTTRTQPQRDQLCDYLTSPRNLHYHTAHSSSTSLFLFTYIKTQFIWFPDTPIASEICSPVDIFTHPIPLMGEPLEKSHWTCAGNYEASVVSAVTALVRLVLSWFVTTLTWFIVRVSNPSHMLTHTATI